MTRFWRLLTSRNTGIVLLTGMSLILLVSAALPVPGLMPPEQALKLKSGSPLLYWLGENFNSMKVGKGIVFALLGSLVLLSTTFCSIDRLIRRWKARKQARPEIPVERAGTGMVAQMADGPASAEERLLLLLRRQRWRTAVADGEGGRIVRAGKGDIGFLGSVFFHAILISLVGGIVVFYFTGLYATMVFTEGEQQEVNRGSFRRVERMPLLATSLPRLSFRFNSFSAKYHDDQTATDYAADFDITDRESARSWKQVFKVNEPLTYRGITYFLKLHGYSPRFVLYKKGVPVYDAFLALNVDGDSRDSFRIDAEGLEVTAQFFPDLVRTASGVHSRSARPNNPYFGLDVASGKGRVFRGLVGKGGEVSFGDYRLQFRDLRHWVGIDLSRETGIGFFFVCAMIGLMGVLARVLDPDRSLLVSIAAAPAGCTLTFYPSAAQFEGIFKERVEEMIQELQRVEA